MVNSYPMPNYTNKHGKSKEDYFKMNIEKINEAINQITYGAAGTDSSLQREISKFIISLMAADTDVTPGQIGYLGCMPVSANGKAFVKLYFIPKLSSSLRHDWETDEDVAIPIPALKCLENWLLVGNINDAVKLEKRTIREYRLVDMNVNGHTVREIEFTSKKDDNGNTIYKLLEDRTVMSVYCNLDLVLAAINDLDLTDPSYKVSVKQVMKKPKASEHVIVSATSDREYPINVTVEYDSRYHGYSPDDAIPYLTKKAIRLRNGYESEKQLQKEAGGRASKLNRENKKRAKQTDFRRVYG